MRLMFTPVGHRYTAAEADCSRCLKLDCDYIKGYLRRATARLNLGKEELARRDCLKVRMVHRSRARDMCHFFFSFSCKRGEANLGQQKQQK